MGGGSSNSIHDKKNYLPIIPGNIEDLLSSKIIDASICFFSMNGPMDLSNNLNWEVISKGILHHSGVILEMENNKLVLLEYGAYPKENEHQNNNYYYPLGNGYRYCLIDIGYINDKVYNRRTLFIISSEKLKRFNRWCVLVKTRKQMTLIELFIKLGNNWKKSDYILAPYIISNNCQDFTNKIIEILDIESRYTSWYNRNMQSHSFLKGLLYCSAYAYSVPRKLAKRISNYNEIDDE